MSKKLVPVALSSEIDEHGREHIHAAIGKDRGDQRPFKILRITGDLANGFVGDTRSYQYLLSGGVAPYTVTINSGELPSGLVIDNDALVEGIFTGAGTYDFVIEVEDTGGNIIELADTSIVYPSSEQEVLADHPVAYWKMDEPTGTVMADSSGNGHHATYIQDAATIQGAAPLWPGSLGSLQRTAKGLGAYISMTGDDAVVNIVDDGPWTIEAIVHCTSMQSWTQMILGGEPTDSGQFGITLCYRTTSPKLRLFIGSTQLVSPNDTNGSPVHVVITCSGNNGTTTMYENGIAVASVSGVKSSFVGNNLNFLGRVRWQNNDGFIGRGSDFAVYDYALAPDRIFAHARAFRFAL